jgi:hypothetical protein
MIENLSYGSGAWVARHVVVPFVNGFLDELMPAVTPRVRVEVQSMVGEMVPKWARRFLE